MEQLLNIARFLQKTALFSGVSIEEIHRLIDACKPKIIEYKRTELVYSSLTCDKRVGIILKGRCEVRREKSNSSRVVLNTIEEHGSFGILSILSEDEFPTSIFATKNSEILFFSAAQIDYFVNNSSQISKNIIGFLANRIIFLNKKIATFSGTRVEDRLAAFILCEREIYKSDSFPFNCQKTSEEINAGRASVYRAIDSFQSDGLIIVDNKKIYITDLEGLERITK